MGLRYHRRIGGRQGFGLNLSGSGVSGSVRTKYGSFGSRGFSLRTGIPGLSFRSGWGGKNMGVFALIFLALALGLWVFQFLIFIIKIAFLGTIWLFQNLYKYLILGIKPEE